MTETKKRKRKSNASGEAKKRSRSQKSNANTNLFSQISNTQKLKLSDANRRRRNPMKKFAKLWRTSNNSMDIVDQAMEIHFVDDIIMRILIKLPVRSLLRSKCVSKSWFTLISDPYFKKQHLIHAKNDFNSQKLLVYTWPTSSYVNGIYSTSLSPAGDVQKHDFLTVYQYSCYDGLILLRLASNSLGLQLVLWNPSTRESVVLPSPEHGLKMSCLGLGYDATSDDYKIIQIPKNDNVRVPIGYILSLKTGSWRKICKLPSAIYPYISSSNLMRAFVFLHGAFHWWYDLCSTQSYCVSAFNISNEDNRLIPITVLDRMPYKPRDSGISLLDGTLCFYSSFGVRGNHEFKVWGLKDYGSINESWVELYSIQIAGLIKAEPMYRFADGEVLLRCQSRDIDEISKSTNVFMTSKGPFEAWPQSSRFQFGVVFTETLISPKLLI